MTSPIRAKNGLFALYKKGPQRARKGYCGNWKVIKWCFSTKDTVLWRNWRRLSPTFQKMILVKTFGDNTPPPLYGKIRQIYLTAPLVRFLFQFSCFPLPSWIIEAKNLVIQCIQINQRNKNSFFVVSVFKSILAILTWINFILHWDSRKGKSSKG